MKKHLHKLILFSATACLSACTAQEPLTDYVDPRIGTAHSRWFFFTPAAVPFGMAKLAPTTDGHLGNPNGWEAVGYDSRHTSIEGFANFHEFQVGGVVVAPTVGELQTVPGPLDNPDAGYRSRFDKKDEVARPGYYSVLLKDYGVKAELTATERVGFHRYTFPATEEANLIFNIGTRMLNRTTSAQTGSYAISKCIPELRQNSLFCKKELIMLKHYYKINNITLKRLHR